MIALSGWNLWGRCRGYGVWLYRWARRIELAPPPLGPAHQRPRIPLARDISKHLGQVVLYHVLETYQRGYDHRHQEILEYP